jgi:xanthine dehydrogenase accessory factor
VRDVLEAVDRWRAAGHRVALGTVVSVERSAPRPPGAKMAISSAGDVSGQVSGGCVEGAVVGAAQEVLDGAPPRLLHFGIADDQAWEVGLPCGGEIGVWVSGVPHPGFVELARAGGRGALVTRLDDGRALLVRADGGLDGSLGDPVLEEAARAAALELVWAERSATRELQGVPCFIDTTAPDPRLVVFGAVDVAVPLCRLARTCGWRPVVVDPRGFFARRDRFPDAEEVIAAWPQEAFARIGGIDRGTSVVVLTHDPKLDDAALEIALRSEAPYVGLDLGALTPEETALSILAELVAVRRGRSGGRLKHSSGRIHEVTG